MNTSIVSPSHHQYYLCHCFPLGRSLRGIHDNSNLNVSRKDNKTKFNK